MICDMHCHILPGVDDGARNEGSTERMLNIAYKDGIDYIVATPHFEYGQEIETSEELKKKYQKVREKWKAMGPKKELFLGNEVFYSEGMVETLNSRMALTMNNTKYVLVEFGMDAGPQYVQRAIQKLRYAGYRPIIAHVERYPLLQSHKVLKEIIDTGAYLQVNAKTITGEHGFMGKFRAMRAIKSNLIHFVASDGHDSKARKPELKQCRECLEKKIGREKARQIFEENPIRMLKGEEING